MQKFNEFYLDEKSESEYKKMKIVARKKISDLIGKDNEEAKKVIDTNFSEFADRLKKDLLDESKETEYKIAMNIIKRALGKEVPTKDDLEEFIAISAEENGFNQKEFSKYVRHHIVHSIPKGKK